MHITDNNLKKIYFSLQRFVYNIVIDLEDSVLCWGRINETDFDLPAENGRISSGKYNFQLFSKSPKTISIGGSYLLRWILSDWEFIRYVNINQRK